MKRVSIDKGETTFADNFASNQFSILSADVLRLKLALILHAVLSINGESLVTKSTIKHPGPRQACLRPDNL